MGVVIATFSTWVTPTVQLLKGDFWDENDPVVRSHPDWFAEVPPDDLVRRSTPAELPVIPDPPKRKARSEQATSGPDDIRAVNATAGLVSPEKERRDLLARAEKLNLKVDGRWSLETLRQEVNDAS